MIAVTKPRTSCTASTEAAPRHKVLQDSSFRCSRAFSPMCWAVWDTLLTPDHLGDLRLSLTSTAAPSAEQLLIVREIMSLVQARLDAAGEVFVDEHPRGYPMINNSEPQLALLPEAGEAGLLRPAVEDTGALLLA